MSANLPVAVTRVGGALQTVSSQIEAYTDPRYPLARRSQIALARIIEDRPELNTEARIAMMVDAFSFHGVDEAAAFTAITDEFGLETTYLALDYLYEVGERGRGTTTGDREPIRRLFKGMDSVRNVADLITELRDSGLQVEGVNTLSDLVFRLGGLQRALNADRDDFASLVDGFTTSDFDPVTESEFDDEE